MYAINSETHDKIIKQIVIDKKPTKEIKWNYKKYSINPQECRKKEKWNKDGKKQKSSSKIII